MTARFSEFYADYFAKEQGEYEQPDGTWVCTSEIAYTGHEAIGRDIANLKAAMDAEGVADGFLPVVAPASCFPTLLDEHYGSEAAALMGIAEALREEYRAIVNAGLQVQIDDAFIPFMYDVLVPPGTMDDHLAWAQPRLDDCGFAQGPYLRRVHPTIQWAKLEALSEGAAIASARLATPMR